MHLYVFDIIIAFMRPYQNLDVLRATNDSGICNEIPFRLNYKEKIRTNVYSIFNNDKYDRNRLIIHS